MKKGEQISGAVLFVLSGLVIWQSLEMPPSASFGPGAGFLPLWLGVLLAVLAMILYITAWRSSGKGKDGVPLFPEAGALFAIVLVLAGLAVYILLIDVLGYVTDTFLFVVFLVKVVEREAWPLTFKLSVGATAGLYLVFHILLKITLPSNMFGF